MKLAERCNCLLHDDGSLARPCGAHAFQQEREALKAKARSLIGLHVALIHARKKMGVAA